MSEWISVEDRLPKEGDKVIACQSSNDIIVTARYYEEMNNSWRTGISPMDYIVAVTHWMPLPEPPK